MQCNGNLASCNGLGDCSIEPPLCRLELALGFFKTLPLLIVSHQFFELNGPVPRK
jgi:hypothetical protein